LSHYTLAGSGKRDYPASILDHCPWWKYYGLVQDYLSRTSLMLTQGEPVRDILIIHPMESAWGLFVLNHAEQVHEIEKLITVLNLFVII